MELPIATARSAGLNIIVQVIFARLLASNYIVSSSVRGRSAQANLVVVLPCLIQSNSWHRPLRCEAGRSIYDSPRVDCRVADCCGAFAVSCRLLWRDGFSCFCTVNRWRFALRIALILQTVAAIGVLTVAVWAALNYSTSKPSAFPLVKPDTFFTVLPGMGMPDQTLNTDPQYFDRLGYLKAPDGARISGPNLWTRRATRDLYDVDLTVNVTYMPTINQATERFATENAKFQRLSQGRTQEIVMQEPMQGDESKLLKFATNAKNPTYILDTRHGNYLFHFVGQIAAGGYFENEAQFRERMQRLNVHIEAVLRHAT